MKKRLKTLAVTGVMMTTLVAPTISFAAEDDDFFFDDEPVAEQTTDSTNDSTTDSTNDSTAEQTTDSTNDSTDNDLFLDDNADTGNTDGGDDFFTDDNLVTEQEPAVENPVEPEVQPVAGNSTEIDSTQEIEQNGDIVSYTLNLNDPTTEIKNGSFIIKYPEVVMPNEASLNYDGGLFDTVDPEHFFIDTEKREITFVGSNKNLVPGNGKVFSIDFDVLDGTAKKFYTFSLDPQKSEVKTESATLTLSGELNKTVILEKGEVVKEVAKVVKKETGAPEVLMFVLAILLAFVARKQYKYL